MKLHLISLSSFIFASVVLSGALTSCSNAALSAIEERLSKLEGQVAELNTVSEQMEAMTNTIHSLFDAQQKIQTRIGNLSDSSASYAAQIADLQARVKYLDPLNMTGAILELQDKMTEALEHIAVLSAADSVLSDRISALEALKDGLAKKDWVNATFATLEAQEATAAALAKVQGLLAGLPEGKTVAEAIEAASTGVKGWVSDTLSHYWTAGVVEGKLTELESKISTLEGKHDAELKAVKKSVQDVQNQLDKAKAEIKTAYTDAINKAMTGLDGRISANRTEIDKAAAAIITLNGQVDSLETEVGKLKDRMAAAESDISGLKEFDESVRAMVQSAVFVPKYKGGSAVVKTLSDINSLTLDYEVLPRKCGKALSDLWNASEAGKGALKVKHRQVGTRAGLQTLEIKGVGFDDTDSLLQVAVSLSDVAETLLSDDKALAVSLEINTGSTMVSSPFTDIDNTLDYVDLSPDGTANCYIVKEAGFYKFKASVKGNGKDINGNDATRIVPTSAKVLWESFGTADAPAVGSLVDAVILGGDNIFFSATSGKGNAVIAVKSGDDILWSWHIWLTDTPEEQVYKSNAGIMMDRNLGATSAGMSNPGALGLLYQWGRKDPFLGSSAIGNNSKAKSTPEFPSAEFASLRVDGDGNTLAYSILHPTVFLMNNSSPWDWYCIDPTKQNYNLWKSTKTMYDPCPVGWRVPDGGYSGVWKNAGFSSTTFDSDNKGISFSVLQNGGSTWYPAAGSIYNYNGDLEDVGSYGTYWSCTYTDGQSYVLNFSGLSVFPYTEFYRAKGNSVRCLKE